MLIPLEQLISPEIVKNFAFNHPQLAEEDLREWLLARGARSWQVELVLPTFLNA